MPDGCDDIFAARSSSVRGVPPPWAGGAVVQATGTPAGRPRVALPRVYFLFLSLGGAPPHFLPSTCLRRMCCCGLASVFLFLSLWYHSVTLRVALSPVYFAFFVPVVVFLLCQVTACETYADAVFPIAFCSGCCDTAAQPCVALALFFGPSLTRRPRRHCLLSTSAASAAWRGQTTALDPSPNAHRVQQEQRHNVYSQRHSARRVVRGARSATPGIGAGQEHDGGISVTRQTALPGGRRRLSQPPHNGPDHSPARVNRRTMQRQLSTQI